MRRLPVRPRCSSGIGALAPAIADLLAIVRLSAGLSNLRHCLEATRRALARGAASSDLDWRVAAIGQSPRATASGRNLRCRCVVCGIGCKPPRLQRYISPVRRADRLAPGSLSNRMGNYRDLRHILQPHVSCAYIR